MNKETLKKSIIKDLTICKRLYSKMPPGKEDFRPKEGMRSTLELLQYISWIGSGIIKWYLTKDGSEFRPTMTELSAPAKTMRYDEFPQRMDEQIADIERSFDSISESDLTTIEGTYPWGAKAPLGEAIIETALKWAASYKLQLFLYVKLNSDEKLSTQDAWLRTEIEAAS